jgi:hypothetical protein
VSSHRLTSAKEVPMREPPRVALYADLACPSAYIAAYHLRKLCDEYRGWLVIKHKSVPLHACETAENNGPMLARTLLSPQ